MSTKISIILSTRNRCASLRQTLNSLAQVRIPDFMECELVVVDNASTDRTVEVVSSCQLANMKKTYVLEPGIGVSRARNRGLKASDGAIILLVDDDVRVPTNWVEGMCEPIVSGRGDAVAGGVKIAPHLQRPWMTARLRRWFASTEEFVPQGPNQFVGASAAFSREILTRVPSFDVNLGPGALGFWEDTLFAHQFVQAGYRLVTAFDVASEHHFDPARLSRRSLLDAARRTGKSVAYFAHHWEHLTMASYWHTARSCLLLLRARAAAGRYTREEGISEWELDYVSRVSFARAFTSEQKRPPNYAKRGLASHPGKEPDDGDRTGSETSDRPRKRVETVKGAVTAAWWRLVAPSLYGLASLQDLWVDLPFRRADTRRPVPAAHAPSFRQ